MTEPIVETPLGAASLPAWRRFAGSPYLLLSLTSFFWALNWVLARDLRHLLGPNATALGRWAVALVLIMPFAWPHLRHDWPQIKRDSRILALLSLIGAGGYNALSYAGVKSTTALNAMLLNATVPFFIMGLSWLFLRERLTLRQTIGLLVSFTGAAWIISAGDLRRLAALQFNQGDLLVLCAMLSWATYTIIVKRHPVRIHLLSFVAVLSVTAVAMLIPLTVIESYAQMPVVTPKVVAVCIYMGIGPSILCYLFWSRGVAAIGPSRTGLFLYLVPVFGSLLSSLILDEHLALFHVVGFAMVLAGLAVSNSGQRSPVAKPERGQAT